MFELDFDEKLPLLHLLLSLSDLKNTIFQLLILLYIDQPSDISILD